MEQSNTPICEPVINPSINCAEVTTLFKEKNVGRDIIEERTRINESTDTDNEVKEHYVLQLKEGVVVHDSAGELNSNCSSTVQISNEPCIEKFEFVEDTEKFIFASRYRLRISPLQVLARKIKKRSIKCLHKMRVMEDVREGCILQPSSPGHAELRPENESENDTDQQQPTDDVNKENPQEDNDVDESPIKEENNIETPHLNGDKIDNDPENLCKRKGDEDETPTKRLCTIIEENFRQRDKILNEFMNNINCDNASFDQLQMYSEQILAEVRSLNDLAREKEMEWNNIIHLKKLKEELFIRIERKRQMLVMNGDKLDSDMDSEDRGGKFSEHSLLRYNLSKSSRADRINRMKPVISRGIHLETNGAFDPRQNIRNRPILDVQSIIADYRQRHPEAVPRRGRRIRTSNNGSHENVNILNLSSVALGSGAQVKQNLQDMGSELNLLLSAINSDRMEGSNSSNAETTSQNFQDIASFKDILVQFAKLSQNERNELLQNAIKPPPPYPEVTVHPVTSSSTTTSNSLLHGILTKSPSKVNNKTAFSPTLARLLTAPERSSGNNHLTSSPSIISSISHPPNMSISEIISNKKARNEITITPVDSQLDHHTVKSQQKGVTEEDETEDSADRLVIDESNEDARRAVDNSSENGDEVPLCQGCNQKTAHFVCAGCGNQWYCSRDCQVSAWDEHSEVCSG